MMLWFVLGAMLLGAVVALLVPLLRTPHAGASRLEHELEVFRDQLAEVERDRARGVVNDAEADAGRREIERRALRAADAAGPRREGAGRASALVAAGLIAVVLPAGATAVYVALGRPWEPDRPLAARELPAQIRTAEAPPPSVAEGAARLEARLADNPGDLQGWTLLARAYWQMQAWDKAATAYRSAIALDGSDPNLHMSLGEALTYVADGMVTQTARAAFEDARSLDGGNPGARYYLALADLQAGDTEAAYRQWVSLAADSPAGAPWLPALRDRIEQTAQALGRDPVADLPAPVAEATRPQPAAGMPQPSQDDVAAAMEMAPEDRQAFIRSMVDGLAARLAENPDDPEGWRRLARSYRVLGDEAKAAEADANAERHAAAAPPAAATPPAAAPPAAMPQPSAEQVQKAMQMPAEDRQAFVRSMVDGLQEKLAANPDDLEGWLRLGRSWEVLGEQAKSKEAYDRALALAPEDPAAVQMAARAGLRAGGRDAPPTDEVIALYRRLLVLDDANPEALFFAGLGDMRDGAKTDGLDKWRRLLAQMDPSDPDHAFIKQRIEEAESGG